MCLAGWIYAGKVEELYFPSLVGLLPAMDRERKGEQGWWFLIVTVIDAQSIA